MTGGPEETGVGWGQVRDEGRRGQAGWPVPAPFILAAPYLSGPQQRSLNGPGNEQGIANVKQKLKG